MIALLKNWKLIGGALLLLGAFIGGWKANGWRITSQLTEQYRAVIEARDEQYKVNLGEALQRERRKLADSLSLQRSNLEARETAKAFSEEVRDVRFENTCPVSDPEFVRLWNRAAGGGSGPETEGPPTG